MSSTNGLLDLLHSEWFAAAIKDPQRVYFTIMTQLYIAQCQPRIVRDHYFSVASVVVDDLLEELPELRAEVIDALQADLITGSEVDPRVAFSSATASVATAVEEVAKAFAVLPEELVVGGFAQDGDSPRGRGRATAQQPARTRNRSRTPTRVARKKPPTPQHLELEAEVQQELGVRTNSAPEVLKTMTQTAMQNSFDSFAIAWSAIGIGATALSLLVGSPLLAVKSLKLVDYSLFSTATNKLVQSYSKEGSKKIVALMILAVCFAALFLPSFVDSTFTTYVEQQEGAARAADIRLTQAQAELGMSRIGVNAAGRTTEALIRGSEDPRQMNAMVRVGEMTQYTTETFGLPLTKTWPAVKAWTLAVENLSWFLPESITSSAQSLRTGVFDFVDDRVAAVQMDDSGSMAIAMRKAWNVVEVTMLPYESLGHKNLSQTIVREASALKSALQLMWKPIIANGIMQVFLLAMNLGITVGPLTLLANRVREKLRGGVESQKVGLRLNMQEPSAIARTYNAVFSNKYITGALSGVNRYVLSPQMKTIVMSRFWVVAPPAVHAFFSVVRGFSPAVPSEQLLAQIQADPTYLQIAAGWVDSFMQTAGPIAMALSPYRQDSGFDERALGGGGADPMFAIEVAIEEGDLATVLRLLPAYQWSQNQVMDMVSIAVGATMAVDRASIPQLMVLKAVLNLPQIPFLIPPIGDEQATMLLVDLVLSGEDDGALARMLLHYGADPNFQDVDGTTLLIVAVGKNAPHILRALLYAGAEVNLRGSESITPLQVAVAMRDPPVDISVLNILLGAGASVYSESPEFHSPVIFALEGETSAVNDAVLRFTITKASPAPPSELRARIEQRLHNTSGPVRRKLNF